MTISRHPCVDAKNMNQYAAARCALTHDSSLTKAAISDTSPASVTSAAGAGRSRFSPRGEDVFGPALGDPPEATVAVCSVLAAFAFFCRRSRAARRFGLSPAATPPSAPALLGFRGPPGGGTGSRGGAGLFRASSVAGAAFSAETGPSTTALAVKDSPLAAVEDAAPAGSAATFCRVPGPAPTACAPHTTAGSALTSVAPIAPAGRPLAPVCAAGPVSAAGTTGRTSVRVSVRATSGSEDAVLVAAVSGGTTPAAGAEAGSRESGKGALCVPAGRLTCGTSRPRGFWLCSCFFDDSRATPDARCGNFEDGSRELDGFSECQGFVAHCMMTIDFIHGARMC